MLYRKSEKEVFKKIKETCLEDLTIWNWVNLGFPLLTVVVSIFAFSNSTKASENNSYYGLILGGVLPLIAVNLIVGAAFFLIKFDKQKEKKFGLNTSNTRLKLIIYAFFSYLISSSLFAIQTIYSPFGTCLQRIVEIILTLVAILFARDISNKLFLLQEDMIEKSFEQDIADNVSKLKNAINEL